MMRFTIALAAMIALLASHGAPFTGVPPAFGQGPYEAEPVLKASDFVAPDILSGPHYTVDPRVPVTGLLARFTIRSDYGTFVANGLHMLQIRVREVHAIAQLDDMSKTKEFTDAAARAALRPVAAAANMALNPVETIAGVPAGVTRLFDRVELGARAIEGAASTPDQSTSQKAADVTERVGGITATALGYEKQRRDLAKGLGVDPYTTNPVLAKKLDDAAWVAFSGQFSVDAAISVFVPYSMAISSVTIIDSTIYDTPSADLINSAQAVFAATGASAAQVQALMQNKQYSVSLLAALARGVQRLQGVAGQPALVAYAALAQTHDQGRFVTAAVNMLARHHESVGPIARVSAPGPIVGHTAMGALIVPAPVDYVAWMQGIARFAQRDDLRAPQRIAWLSGWLSRRASKEFAARSWEVKQAFSIRAER